MYILFLLPGSIQHLHKSGMKADVDGIHVELSVCMLNVHIVAVVWMRIGQVQVHIALKRLRLL